MSRQLHTYTRGIPREGTALVFLHGFMGSGQEWLPIVEGLEPDVPYVLVDLPGHGASVEMPPEAYTFAGAVEAIAATLQREKVTRPLFIGYSMGGRLALALALEYGSRCAGLWMESASPGIEESSRRRERLVLDRQRAEQLKADFEQFLADWYRLPLFRTLQRYPERLEQLYQRRKQQVPEELARALVGMSPAHQPNYWPELSTLTMPVSYICGQEDERYVCVARRVKQRLPSAGVHVFPDVGHRVHLEAPDAYIRELSTFIRTCIS